MSLTLIKHGDQLEILEGDLPLEQAVKVYTEDEVKQMEAWVAWMSMTEEQRNEFMLQTQSSEYREWMDEEEWEECKVMEGENNPYKVGDSNKGDME